MTISHDNGYGTIYTFEVVDKIPSGYAIWNIPRKGLEGYLPICQVKPGSFSVEAETLKAVPVPEEDAVKLIRAKGMFGIDSLSAAEWKIKRTKKPVPYFFTEVRDLLKKYTA